MWRINFLMYVKNEILIQCAVVLIYDLIISDVFCGYNNLYEKWMNFDSCTLNELYTKCITLYYLPVFSVSRLYRAYCVIH